MTLNSRTDADKYLRALTAVSESPDALQELEHRLAMSLSNSVGGVSAANRVAAFCVSKDVLNDTANLAALRSSGDPRSAEALKAAENLVGRSDSARSLALNVIIRALRQESNELQ